MAGLLSRLSHLFRGEPAPVSEEEERALREAFRRRCLDFKLLLAANNKALEIMADMEGALRGTRPFGMNLVRSQCARVSASVYQIVKHLDSLSRGRYPGLFDAFKAVQQQLAPIVAHRPAERAGPLVLPLAEIDARMSPEVGGKVANLGELASRLGLPIPAGFAVTASGYERFMQANDLIPEIERRIQATDAESLDQVYSLSARLQQLIIRSPLPEDLARAILDNYRRIEEREGAGVRVALRSSALGEDAEGASFAGQYRSELNVSGDDILDTYKEIVASKYGVTAMTYRFTRGIRDEDVAMCVGCMSMVEARSGGVMYSRNPLDFSDPAVVINAVPGLPKTVVDGSADPDVFTLSRTDPPKILKREIAEKTTKYVCDPEEGVCRLELAGEEATAPAIDDEQAAALAAIAVTVEGHYGQPQDIEWAVDAKGRIVLLQSRPLHKIEQAKEHVDVPANLPETALAAGGVTASPGAAAGQVFVVRKDMDALRFTRGSVLVAEQAQPRWATMLSRAAAVVTEMGSTAGHLANVAREFGVPALLGVKGAIAALQNTGVVTVDADARIVHQGAIESLLARREKPKNLMEGSPVHAALAAAAAHVVPLTLLDPDAPEFRPENCKTMHDITRFCHEKSVRDMFDQGKDAPFPEKSSKQLVVNGVPMQYFVIDLEDGFSEQVAGRRVDIANIASKPMLALWRGMTSIPWAGPPAVSAKGFMSVLVEAAANPDLDPARHSSFAMRNYFMISKTFVSLQSRFGFHFCTAEALAGPIAHENYASFQFKGGAADLQRRVLRARLVGDVLEERGFHAEIKEDALFARAEGYDEAAMLDRLRILGHLIIHTRQIDMAMSGPAAANQYKAKIEADLEKQLAMGGEGETG